MKKPDAARAIRRLRDDAEHATRAIAPPDVDALVEAASRDADTKTRTAGVRWRDLPLVPAIAAAAAIVVAVFGLRVVNPAGDGTTDPPEELLIFVDSLYDDGGYVLDEIAARWSPIRPQTGPAEDYLDSVWNDVLDDLAAPDN